MKKISIIIRVRNEAENLKILLPILQSQTEKNTEIVLVDNESTDRTRELAKSYGATIVNIPYSEFTFAKALNRGATAAQGKILAIISAHSFPLSKNWLVDGLRHFTDKKIAGVYGPTLAYKDSALIEKIDKLPGALFWYLRYLMPPIKHRKVTNISHKMGLLGFTNAMVLKNLWEKHNFDERYEAGGEDGEWAGYFLNQGYEIVWDPKFAVRHAHRLRSWKNLRKQYVYWRGLDTPRKFKREEIFSFREDSEKYNKNEDSRD